MSINLYVEGGGDARIDRLARDAFRSLFQGHVQQLPHVVMGRGGNDTIKKFVAERRRGGSHVLLIDLEGPRSKSPLRVQFESVDSTLAEVEDRDLHCMVQFMETWLLASESGLRGRYKPRKDAALPPWASPPVELESIPRDQIAKWLKRTFDYEKRDGFRILRGVDAMALKSRCPHAARLFERLNEPA